MPVFSHGTLGIVYALAAVGHAAGRGDVIDLALVGDLWLDVCGDGTDHQ